MKNALKLSKITAAIALMFFISASCENTDPSVAKVYVRSVANQLVEGAQVVLVADVDNATTTVEYVDTALTNGSGFAQFNMDPYFSKAGADNSVGVFDVFVKKGDDKGSDQGFRVRIHNTAVRTVNFEE